MVGKVPFYGGKGTHLWWQNSMHLSRMNDPTLEGLRIKIVRASIFNGLDRTMEHFNKLGEAKILDSADNN